MGGAVGVIRANLDPRLRFLVSLAAIVHTQAFARRAFGQLRPGAGLMFDKPGCVLTQAYLDDMSKIDSLLDQAARIDIPWLFVHGRRDELVPIGDSYDAYAQAKGFKELIVLEQADHVFEPGQTPAMVQAVAEWCRSQFEG
jgi:fermentation-respiration switch protein FrsA (DUF1100 family)